MRLLTCPREMLRDQRSYAIIGTAQEAGQGNAAGPDSHRHSRDGGRRRANIVIPATAGIHGGGRLRWGSRLHGNDGGRRRTTHGRRRRTHIVIPATAGIHGGETAMGSRLHGNDGGRRRWALQAPDRRRRAPKPRRRHRIECWAGACLCGPEESIVDDGRTSEHSAFPDIGGGSGAPGRRRLARIVRRRPARAHHYVGERSRRCGVGGDGAAGSGPRRPLPAAWPRRPRRRQGAPAPTRSSPSCRRTAFRPSTSPSS